MNNIPYLKEISDTIIFINSTECYMELEGETIYHIPNNKYLGYSKLIYGIIHFDYKEYDRIILTNDSFIITRSLSDYKDLMYSDSEMVCICDSNEQRYHYPDYMRAYTPLSIKKLRDFYNINTEVDIQDDIELIRVYEVNSTSIFSSVSVLYNSPYNFNGNIHFVEPYFSDYLCNKNYPIIKLKKLLEYNGKYPPFLRDILERINFPLDKSI